MDSDVKWFLGFIGIFALLWIAGGGVNGANTKRPFVRPITEGGGTYGEDFLPGTSKDTSKNQTIQKPTSNTISKDLDKAKQDAEQIKKDLAEIEKYSPLKGKLTLSRYSNSYGNDPNTEQLIIQAAYDNKNPVLLSGLTLKSAASGNRATIGKGSTLIIPGSAINQDPIYLAPGGFAYISTGRSPVGSSFRLNLCTGYFEQKNDFRPGLSLQCPKVADEAKPEPPNQLSDGCLDYIDRIWNCTIPDSIPLYLDGYCQMWISEETTYNRCVEHHRNDADFFNTEWRIYLNQDRPIWKQSREIIQLLDTSDKVISEISY